MALNRRRFIEWIGRRMLYGDNPARFDLCHLDRARGSSLVVKLQPLPNVATDDIANHIADEVHNEVLDHIEGWPGRQQYAIRAFTAGGEEVGEFPFVQTANSVIHTNAGEMLSEATPEQNALASGMLPNPEQLGHPTAMGAQQLMRHTEQLTRFTVEMASMRAERDAQIIRIQQTSIDKHTAQQSKMVEVMEAMYSRQAERDLAEKTYRDDESRKERLLDNLTRLVVPALAKRAGVPAELVGAATAVAGDGAGDGAARSSVVRDIFLKLPENKSAL